MLEAITILNADLPHLPAKDQDFALSLMAQFEKKGQLSEKQVYWLGVLAKRATIAAQVAAGVPDFTEPEKVVVDVGSFAGVIALFKKAGEKLKYPAIRLQLPDAKPLVLKVAGPTAKRPGTVNVSDGGPYGDNVWYGRVTPDGGFEPSQKVDADTMTAVSALLIKLGKSPARVASAYGKLTGNCCFCSIPLTDPKSVEAGYGPVCAKNYGLPWGKAICN